MYLIGVLAILCHSSLITATSWNNLTHGKIVTCPIPTQSVLDYEKNLFKYDEADWTLCSHLIVLDDEFLQIQNGEVSDDKRVEEYKKILDLRSKYPHLNISLTASPVEMFKKYIEKENEHAVANFCTKVADSLKSQKFDGIDLNFMDLKESFLEIEWLSTLKDVFPVLLSGLKQALNERNLSMTCSFSAPLDFISLKLNLTEYVDNFELFHIYPLNIGTKPKTSLAQVQHEMDPWNGSDQFEKIRSWGIPGEKIILGVMLGGPETQTTLNGNITEANTGPIVGYNQVCHKISTNESCVKSIDDRSQLVSFECKDETLDRKTVITYANTRSIAASCKCAIESNFSGVLAYNIAGDDFRGDCELDDENDTWEAFYLGCGAYEPVPKRVDNKFAFMRTINEAIYKTVMGATGGASICTHSSIYMAFALLGILLSSVLSI